MHSVPCVSRHSPYVLSNKHTTLARCGFQHLGVSSALQTKVFQAADVNPHRAPKDATHQVLAGVLVGEKAGHDAEPAPWARSRSLSLRPEGKGYVLHVPPVQPALPVAVDTAKIELETSSGWTSPNRELNVQSTLRQLGPELERRSTLPQYLQLQEPQAAKTVEEFARKWLREQGKPLPANLRVVFRSGGA